MKLAALNPRWITGGVGMTFDCPGPCCAGTTEKRRLFVLFEDDSLPPGPPDQRRWKRTGTTFDMLTLAPSIDFGAIGHWHGHVQAGEIV
jgi:hypothetical protein